MEEIAELSAPALETHLSTVYKLLAKTLTAAQTSIPTIAASNALFDRLSLLGYLNSISSCAEVSQAKLLLQFSDLIISIDNNVFSLLGRLGCECSSEYFILKPHFENNEEFSGL